MKWIGQNIWDQVSRFRNHVYLEDSITLSTGKSITMDEYTSGTISITKIQDSGTTFNDNDTSLMTAAAIADKIEAYGYSTATGDITGVTAGTGLSGGGSSGDVTLNVDAAQSGITSLGTLTGLTIDADKTIANSDGAMLHIDNCTITDGYTSEGATASKFFHVSIERPILASSATGVTTTDAATLYISGAPSAGTNQTLTRAHSLWVDDGTVRLDGELYMGTTRAMDNSGLLRVANQSTITGLGTISSGTWQGTAIASGYLDCSGVTNVGTLVDLAVTGSSSLGGPSMALTHQDVDQIALDIDASNTTANILDINAQALTTGAAIYIDCNSLDTSVNGGALHIDVDESSTTGIQNTLTHINYDRTGDLEAAAPNATVGLDISMNDLATSNHATSTSRLTALDINLDHANANALLTQQTGIDLTLTDADTGYIGTSMGTVGIKSTVEDGGFDIVMRSSADTGDHCTIATTTHGATTITTVDDDAAAAHFEVAADGDITLDAAGTIKLEGPVRPTGQLQCTYHGISDDIDGDVVYLSLLESDAENTSIGNKHLPIIAPVDGKLLKIFVRTTVDQSSETFTWKLYTRTTSQSTNGAAAEIGAQSGAGPTNKTMVTYDFTTGLDSGTNAFNAGDKVLISLESGDGATANGGYFITCLWEWNYSSIG